MNRQNKIKDIVNLVILSLILSLSILLTVLIIISNSKLTRTEKQLLAVSVTPVPEASSTEPPSQNAVAPQERLYVLGEKDGKVTVFASDGTTVIDMLDTYVYSLPFSDREAISAGIAVYSVNELVALIQDYTS